MFHQGIAAPRQRIAQLDAIRGFAVMGIFSANIVTFALPDAAYYNPAAAGGWHGLDLAAFAFNLLVIDSRMRSLFSMLFGASLLLVADRAEAAGASPARIHYARMLVLMAVGIAHFIGLFSGDILTLYALAGMIAFAFRRRSARTLAAVGALLLVLHVALFALMTRGQYYTDHFAHLPHARRAMVETWNQGFGALYPTPAQLAAERSLHLGPWTGLAAARAARLGEWLSNSLAVLPDTLGLMLIGMAGLRSGFLTGAWSRRRYRAIALVGIGLGLAGGLAILADDVASRFWVIALMGHAFVTQTPLAAVQALGYAALVILAVRRRGALMERVAAAGRCAFSNYLGSSLLASFLFDGWGLGWFGTLSRWQSWLVVPLAWLLMLAWSKPWLERFRYGPLEWAWRSLARGRLQPMRRDRALLAA